MRESFISGPYDANGPRHHVREGGSATGRRLDPTGSCLGPSRRLSVEGAYPGSTVLHRGRGDGCRSSVAPRRGRYQTGVAYEGKEDVALRTPDPAYHPPDSPWTHPTRGSWVRPTAVAPTPSRPLDPRPRPPSTSLPVDLWSDGAGPRFLPGRREAPSTRQTPSPTPHRQQ